MRSFFHSSRIFWSAAIVAAAFVLVGSVELGKVVGARLLARGVGEPAAAPDLALVTGPEVIGGQPHAAAVPGQTLPIWPSAHASPASQAAPAVRVQTEPGTPRMLPIAPSPAAAAASVPAVRRPAARPPISQSPSIRPAAPAAAPRPAPTPVAASSPTPRPAPPRPALTPIAQITPPDQNMGY